MTFRRSPLTPVSYTHLIQVFDAASDDDLLRIGWRLGVSGVRLCAGCAGFAAVLANLLALSGPPPQVPALEKILFIACGSVNPVTLSLIHILGFGSDPRGRRCSQLLAKKRPCAALFEECFARLPQ